jgi:hypothetical protein
MVSMNAYWDKISTFFVWIISARPVGPSIWWNEEVIFTELQNLHGLISCLIIRSIQLVILGYPLCLDTHVVRHAAWVCSFWGCLRFRPTAIVGYDPVVGWFEVTIDTHVAFKKRDVDGCSGIPFSDQRHATRYETGGRQLNGDLSMGQNPGTLVFTLK